MFLCFLFKFSLTVQLIILHLNFLLLKVNPPEEEWQLFADMHLLIGKSAF